MFLVTFSNVLWYLLPSYRRREVHGRSVSPVVGSGMLIIGEDKESFKLRDSKQRKALFKNLDEQTGGFNTLNRKKTYSGVNPNVITGFEVGYRPEDEALKKQKDRKFKAALDEQREVERQLRATWASENKRADPDAPLPYMRY